MNQDIARANIGPRLSDVGVFCKVANLAEQAQENNLDHTDAIPNRGRFASKTARTLGADRVNSPEEAAQTVERPLLSEVP